MQMCSSHSSVSQTTYTASSGSSGGSPAGFALHPLQLVGQWVIKTLFPHPWGNMDNYIKHHAQLSQVKVIYDLMDKLSLSAGLSPWSCMPTFSKECMYISESTACIFLLTVPSRSINYSSTTSQDLKPARQPDAG